MIVANATGCSCIYGANLPTTPWTVNAEGRGPAWANSPVRGQRRVRPRDAARPRRAGRLRRGAARASSPRSSARPSPASCSTAPRTPSPRSSRSASRVAKLRDVLGGVDGEHAQDARQLLALSTDLVKQGVWIVGGDGWAYDIGFGGLDHVLVVGPEREHPRARHRGLLQHRRPGVEGHAARRGREVRRRRQATGKKDLGAIARAYGNVFVAQIAMGANDAQTIKALLEAEAWPGPRWSSRTRPASRTASTWPVHEPPEGRGQDRLLAALPLPAQPRSRTATPFKLDSRQAVDPDRASSWPARRGSRSSSGPTPSGPPSSPSWPRPMRTSAGAYYAAGRHPAERARTSTQRGGHGRRDRACPRSRGRRRARRSDVTATCAPAISASTSARPLVASSSPLTGDPSRGAAAGGRGRRRASCCPRCSRRRSSTTRSSCHGPLSRAPSSSPRPATSRPGRVPGRRRPYLRPPREAKKASIPVIASLNATVGGWVRYARLVAGGGRRCARAQPVPPGRDPGMAPPPIRSRRPRRGRRGPAPPSGSRSPSS